MSAVVDWDALRAAAERVAVHAYAPYSKFQVGAALLSQAGRVYVGCNVENASFGLTICAERNAVFAAISDAARQFVAMALVSSADAPVAPCGACRQVLLEFAPSFELRCFGRGGAVLSSSSAALLPHAFTGGDFRDP